MPPRTKRPSARDRILTAASELFYKEGVQNVGIDRIIAESGVAKMSLYNNFKSKDALIAAYLQQQDESWDNWFTRRVEEITTEPRERLLVVFDVLQEWFEAPNFRGCAFINSAVELADPDHPGYQVSLRHQQVIKDYLLSLVKATQLPNPEIITQQLVILINGATIVAMMEQSSDAAQQAKQAATILIETGYP
ncbi:transcriptional regulator [Leptolyngbya sp. PCC 7375]|nr:transcriptional regulator [Leptolyngbya sp. PCC 7375]